jgi:WD40 repeat protein
MRIKAFLCVCQIDLIPFFLIRNHLLKSGTHRVVKKIFIPSKIAKRNKIRERCSVVKSSQLILQKDSYFLTQKCIHKVLRFFCELINPNYLKISENISISLTLGILSSSESKSKLLSELSSFYLKENVREITILKYEKQIFTLSLNYFLKNHSSQIFSLCLSRDNSLLISGEIEGLMRIWNPLNLDHKACLFSHSYEIRSLDIDFSSTYGISGSSDSSICIWNLKKQKLKASFKEYSNPVYSVMFSRNWQYFLSGSLYGRVNLWSYSQKVPVFQLKLFSNILVSYIKNYQEFLVLDLKGLIKIFDISEKKELRERQTKSNVICGHFTPDLEILFTGNKEGFIQIIEIKDLKIIKSFKGHKEEVRSLSFCKKSKKFASGSFDNNIIIWRFPNCYPIEKIIENNIQVFSVILKNNLLYSGGSSSKIFLRNVRRKNNGKFKTNLEKFYIYCLAVSVKLNFIAYGFEKVNLYSMEIDSNVKSRVLEGEIASLTFFKTFLLCGTNKGKIFLLTTPDLNTLRQYFFETAWIYFIRMSEDCKTLAFSTRSKLLVMDIRKKTILLKHQSRVETGKIRSKYFVFVDAYNKIFLSIDFQPQVQILTGEICNVFIFKDLNYILFRNVDSGFLLFDLKKKLSSKLDRETKELKEIGGCYRIEYFDVRVLGC